MANLDTKPIGSESPALTPAQFSMGFQVPAEFIEETRTYGPYRRNGKLFLRNYHRHIKNGLTFFGVARILAEMATQRVSMEVFNGIIQD